MNKFDYKVTGDCFKGNLIYSDQDGFALSFYTSDSRVKSYMADVSFAFSKTLELWFQSTTGNLFYVDGYCYRQSWKDGEVIAPKIQKGEVTANLDDYEVTTGVSIQLDGLEDADTIYDAETGWIRIGTEDVSEGIEIADGIVIGLVGSEIKTIWLKPSIKE